MDDRVQAKNVAMTAIFVCMVMSVLYIELMGYKQGKTDLEFKEWDMQTCTTADYAVRLNFT